MLCTTQDLLPRYHDSQKAVSSKTSEELLWYFAYGSNMSRQKFTEGRGIVPLAVARVSVPGWRLTMEVPGLPYIEPGMSSIRKHESSKLFDLQHRATAAAAAAAATGQDRDVTGIAYLVTRSQYISIIASEGGGIAYDDVELKAQGVTSQDQEILGGLSVMVHALVNVPCMSRYGCEPRPSERYKALLTTGAREAALPEDYQEYLRAWPVFVRPSRRLMIRQSRNALTDVAWHAESSPGRGCSSPVWTDHPARHVREEYEDDESEDEDDDNLKRWLGALIFLAVFTPMLAGMEKLTKRTIQANTGLVPRWVKWIVRAAVWVIWWCHDVGFSPIFGRGDGRVDLDTGTEGARNRSSHKFEDGTGRELIRRSSRILWF